MDKSRHLNFALNVKQEDAYRKSSNDLRFNWKSKTCKTCKKTRSAGQYINDGEICRKCLGMK